MVGGYERVLLPPSSKEDIAHCINKELLDRQSGAGLWPSARDLVAINCAGEALFVLLLRLLVTSWLCGSGGVESRRAPQRPPAPARRLPPRQHY